MADDWGVKVAKDGYTADVPLTEANKKNFAILSAAESHKLLYANYVTTGSYTHNLGRKPFFLVFVPDSTVSPTYFTGSMAGGVNNTQITNLPNPSYLMVFSEGV